jgi:predicted enzyme related to lactoylglutathione lyase
MDERLLKQGMFSWNELMTTDVEGARKFYTDLLGWTTEELQMEGGNYTVIKVGGEEIGGMMITPPQAKGVPPHWGAYVTVDDVDATATKANDLGGNILVPPTDIPDVGRFSVVQDPQGAALAIITYLKRD